jgi:hypothetical protein
MIEHFLGNYLDPIAKVWSDTQPMNPPPSVKKGKNKKISYQKTNSFTCNVKKELSQFGGTPQCLDSA